MSVLDNPVIRKIAEKHGITTGQVLLSWGLAGETAVVREPVNPDRIRPDLAAADLPLDQQDMEDIANLDQGYHFVDGSFFEGAGIPPTP